VPPQEFSDFSIFVLNLQYQSNQKACQICLAGFLITLTNRLWQGTVDGTERVADLGTDQAHNRNHNEGDKRKNNRILDQTLTFFFGTE
jgi:hypothetical protein